MTEERTPGERGKTDATPSVSATPRQLPLKGAPRESGGAPPPRHPKLFRRASGAPPRHPEPCARRFTAGTRVEGSRP